MDKCCTYGETLATTCYLQRSAWSSGALVEYLLPIFSFFKLCSMPCEGRLARLEWGCPRLLESHPGTSTEGWESGCASAWRFQNPRHLALISSALQLYDLVIPF